ncbi:MAG: hypothetical protein AB1640_15340 [bacterium]
MSHTSQRRGLDPARPGEEIIVLAMLPRALREKEGALEAMKQLARKILEHEPHSWISHNFLDQDIPQLGSKASLLRLLRRLAPEAARDLLFAGVAEKSSVITALYTSEKNACALLNDLEGSWLENNRREGYPVSIVLSGLFEDIERCCGRTGIRQHTYLHSLGFRGQVSRVPAGGVLELATMCGHGLISCSRVQALTDRVRRGEMTAALAAADVAKPCVCGIVNRERAERVFRRLAEPAAGRLLPGSSAQSEAPSYSRRVRRVRETEHAGKGAGGISKRARMPRAGRGQSRTSGDVSPRSGRSTEERIDAERGRIRPFGARNPAWSSGQFKR